jgi:spore germination protein
MRRVGFWAPVSILAVLGLAVWGIWTWRVTKLNGALANQVEATRQRSFSDMAYHVEKIQSLLGKGLVSGTARQNMRYLSDAHHHALSAANSFSSLPLPAQLNASVGKFLKQTGDFAWSVMNREASGGQMDAKERTELSRLQQSSADLSAQLQTMAADYNKGGFRWSPPVKFSWANILRRPVGEGKPATGAQAPASMAPSGWDQVGTSMEKLPVFVYDGPFSDGKADRTPAVTGAPLTQDDAAKRVALYVPNAKSFGVVGVTEVKNHLPAYSFRLAPAADTNRSGGALQYTAKVEIAKNGGHLVQLLNSRMGGPGTLDLARARTLGQQYLTSVGYTGMVPTFGQVADGFATIAYAFEENGVVIYPDQVKVKVALDNGEIVAADAKQYLMAHHQRTIGQPKLSQQQAQEELRAGLNVQRVQLALIPNPSGTGETLTYEFLTAEGDATFLIYINANTGAEEQILQQIQHDGGTFAL